MKNKFLLSIFVTAQIPSLFYGTKERMNLSLLIERSTRLDFVAYYYAVGINFLILAYCLHYHKGVSKRVTRFILIVMSLDLLHLLLFAKQKYGMAKIGIAILLYGIYEWRAVLRIIRNIYEWLKYKKWRV